MTDEQRQNLVFAVYPFTKGFAFVLFEGSDSPFEWGVKGIQEKHKNSRILNEVKKLIDLYRPEVMVIEDTTNGGSRRTSRIRKLYRMLVHLAAAEYVELRRYTRREVNGYFASVGAKTKHEIAQTIALRIPAFAHRMPRFRRAWMSGDPRQSLFDATALALFFYANTGTLPNRE